jgi:hypothetical protein
MLLLQDLTPPRVRRFRFDLTRQGRLRSGDSGAATSAAGCLPAHRRAAAGGRRAPGRKGASSMLSMKKRQNMIRAGWKEHMSATARRDY